jgi:beta-mannosidase
MKITYGVEVSPERTGELIDAVNFYVADALKVAIEDFRQQKFRRTGIVWWSLLDMWPMGFNYSVVDSSFTPKLPFYTIALAQQPLALMAMDSPDNKALPRLHAVNDTRKTCNGTYRITTLQGKEVAAGNFTVAANSVANLGELPVDPADFVIIHWNCEDKQGANYFMRDGQPFNLNNCRKMADLLRHGLPEC